jgi:hypothetical protein
MPLSERICDRLEGLRNVDELAAAARDLVRRSYTGGASRL